MTASVIAAAPEFTHELNQDYLFHAAQADLLRRLKQYAEAASAYRKAAALTTNPVEAAFLERRLRELPAV